MCQKKLWVGDYYIILMKIDEFQELSTQSSVPQDPDELSSVGQRKDGQYRIESYN